MRRLKMVETYQQENTGREMIVDKFLQIFARGDPIAALLYGHDRAHGLEGIQEIHLRPSTHPSALDRGAHRYLGCCGGHGAHHW